MSSSLVPQNHPSHHKPAATALLLLDYHSKYLEYIPDAQIKSKLIAAVKTLIKTARENKLTTTKPTFTANPALVAEYSDFAIDDDAPTLEMTFLRRPGHISALKSEGLLAMLQDHGVKSLVMCGLSSSGCLLSTARQASDEDFVVGVVADGCWDSKPELHKAVMESLLAPHAWTLGLDEAARILKGDSVSI